MRSGILRKGLIALWQRNEYYRFGSKTLSTTPLSTEGCFFDAQKMDRNVEEKPCPGWEELKIHSQEVNFTEGVKGR